SGSVYIPNDLRAAEIETAMENLLSAHRNINNFYNEPPFARALERLIAPDGRLPTQVNRRYVLGLVEVYLTNGYGIAWNAEPVYEALFGRFDSTQALLAILSFSSDIVSSRLQFPRCQEQFRKMLVTMKEKVSAAAVHELMDDIEKYSGPLDKMKDVTRIKQRVDHIRKILA
ncbi:MAG: hypothetical protein ACR2PL_04490, partial [Dehalococcoidia bacterium]